MQQAEECLLLGLQMKTHLYECRFIFLKNAFCQTEGAFLGKEKGWDNWDELFDKILYNPAKATCRASVTLNGDWPGQYVRNILVYFDPHYYFLGGPGLFI